MLSGHMRTPRDHRSEFRIAPDHPALPGHFPGHPVVPGVLLLDGVIEAATRWLGAPLRVRGLRQAKFIAPLLPGEVASIDLELAGDSLDFVIQRDGTTVAKGCLLVDPAVES
jgi:3-hydroxymyristoyl/3-hydroxydecanoyl-(acyl carrier protein) dehydratase